MTRLYFESIDVECMGERPSSLVWRTPSERLAGYPLGDSLAWSVREVGFPELPGRTMPLGDACSDGVRHL